MSEYFNIEKNKIIDLLIFNRLRRSAIVYPLFWILGLVPIWGIATFLYISRKFSRFSCSEIYLIIFGFIQFSAILVAISGDWFQVERVLPALHNLFLYGFFLLGVLISRRFPYGVICFSRSAGSFIYISGLISLLIITIAYNIGFSIIVNMPYSAVSIVRPDWLFGINVPRLSLFGSYVNSSAILFFQLFILYYISQIFSGKQFSLLRVILIYFVMLSLAVFAGSRIVIFSAILFGILGFFKNIYCRYLMLLFLLSLMMYLFLNNNDFINYVLNAREDSTSTRFELYSLAIKEFINRNIFLGLGIKPKFIEISLYPIGSHSTWLGYFVRCGLAGGLFSLIALLFVLANTILSFVKAKGRIFSLWWALSMLILVYSFEDMDAYEPNSFLFGLIVGLILIFNKELAWQI